MTLICYKFEFSWNFAWFRRFERQQRLRLVLSSIGNRISLICCRFLRYKLSYMHCCRALTLASARLSCFCTRRGVCRKNSRGGSELEVEWNFKCLSLHLRHVTDRSTWNPKYVIVTLAGCGSYEMRQIWNEAISRLIFFAISTHTVQSLENTTVYIWW